MPTSEEENKGKEYKMIHEKYMTKKQLRQELNCPGYIISYLHDCGKLPIVRDSKGKGYPILYHPDCVRVIQEHMRKQIDG